MADVCESFRVNCAEGIVPDAAKMTENLNRSLMLVTCLSPKIGYERAADCAKHALKNNCSLKEAAVSLGLLTESEFDELVRPEKMV